MEPIVRNTGGAAPAPKVVDAPSVLTSHPKVNAAVFAGALSSLVLGTLKARWNIDLAGQESNLMVVVMGAVAYLTPS